MRGDLEALASMVAEAMASDPLQAAFLPDERRRPEVARALFRLLLRQGLASGTLFVTSSLLEGVALWESPSVHLAGDLGSILTDGGRLLRQAGLRPIARMARYFRFSSRLHRRLTPFPHWYLALLAVSPAYQGRGLASALLRPVLTLIDRQRVRCYLETHAQRNVPLYEHFGFKVAAIERDPATGVRQWCMLRPPGQGPP